MIFVGYKTFSIKDTIKFSKLSKDKNRIHFDYKISKLTQYDKPIVHASLILTYIFFLLKNKYLSHNQYIQSFDAIFKEPIFVNEKIKFYLKKNSNFYDLIITNGINKKIIVQSLINEKKNIILKKIKINFLNKVFFVSDLEKNLYEHLMLLSKFVGNYKRKINLITLISLKLENKKKNIKKFKVYNNKLINLLLIKNKYQSSTNFISYTTQFKEINSISKIKKKKLRNKLKNKEILVIGGSSGLGKIITNFLSKENLKLTFTYNNNHKKAKELYSTLRKKNVQLKLLRLNEKIIRTNKIKKMIQRFSYIYFFATPKIFNFGKDYFDLKKFYIFNKIYIDFFKKIIDNLIHSDKKYKIYVPSTHLLNLSFNSTEYTMSKLIQEKICKRISRDSDNIKIFNPRLEAYYTRSTHHMLQNNYNYETFIESALKILKN